MRDRWDEEEEELGRGRDRGRTRRSEPEPEREPTIGELIEGSVRKLVTGMVIAGALIGLGVYGSGSGGGSAAPEYQITTSADGRTVYRVNTDSGSIVACRDNNCWLMQRGNRGLDDEPPTENVAAPPPAQVAPQQPPVQVAPAQQPPAQLPAPQNSAVPATR
jgi:hypothetical protein